MWYTGSQRGSRTNRVNLRDTARRSAWHERHSCLAKDWQVRAILLHTLDRKLSHTLHTRRFSDVTGEFTTCLRWRSNTTCPRWRSRWARLWRGLKKSRPEKEAQGIATGWQGNSDLMEAVLWQEFNNTPLWRIQMFVLYLSKASLSYGVCATRTQ